MSELEKEVHWLYSSPWRTILYRSNTVTTVDRRWKSYVYIFNTPHSCTRMQSIFVFAQIATHCCIIQLAGHFSFFWFCQSHFYLLIYSLNDFFLIFFFVKFIIFLATKKQKKKRKNDANKVQKQLKGSSSLKAAFFPTLVYLTWVLLWWSRKS